MTIRRELGRGAMGAVYQALDPELDRLVAIKVIAAEHASDGDFVQRFKREARMAARIDHPHAVPVYRAGDDNGLLYLVTRYIDGMNLKELIEEQGRLAPAAAVRLIGQVAAALDAAHAEGVVHRDVKPANILVGGTGTDAVAYLADFGLTRSVAASSVHITSTGGVVGTPAYMAHELFAGDPASVASDVYSLGRTLQMALVGRLFGRWATIGAPGSTIAEVVPDRRMAEGLDGVLLRAMEVRPEDRYRSAGDLGAAAARIVAAGSTVPVRPPAPRPAAVPPRAFAPTQDRWAGPPHDAPRQPPVVPRDAPRYGPPVVDPAVERAPLDGPARPRRRTWATAVASSATAVALVGGYLLWDPTSEVDGPGAVTPVDLVLQPVVDSGARVRLTWTGPDLDYGVEITPEGGRPSTVLAGRVDSAEVAVQPGVRYCFRVSGTDGGQLVSSNVQPVRDASCPAG
ncbi:serine/threonine-protein kinase [Pseudonocardia petroleophila]|uniref:non-specific serine/threonine protein kinase n=1 Tax=Pseudonocardia petroleophila TaxID=37331 RepID=A0A7G7MJN5_9PSEU|nr:serine/threonine-protein kinase [Pseudonocardia petroleophila]QNG52996.1 serine/threonine protein kinase [Pseudonocardia petroleophila]